MDFEFEIAVESVLDAFIEVAADALARPTEAISIALVAFTAVPMLAFLLRGWLASFIVLIAFAAAAVLLAQAMEPLLALALLITSSVLLMLREVGLMYRRVAAMEELVTSLNASVKGLQLAEGRRQLAVSRQPIASATLSLEQSDTSEVAAELANSH